MAARLTWTQIIRSWLASLGKLALTNADIQAAVAATDQWIGNNQASFNTALPQTFRSTASLVQKTMLFVYVAAKRANLLQVAVEETDVWYALYYIDTGELYSLGSTLASPVPAEFDYKIYLGNQPDSTVYEWDPVVRDFALKPDLIPVDRTADLLADAELDTVWSVLSVDQRQALQRRIGRMLGPQRFRYADDPVDISG